MANKKTFASAARVLPDADTMNRAGGAAYALETHAALAQLAVTGCFNDTFYTTAQDQLADVLRLAESVDSDYLAKLAVYAREKGFMKDTPALLLTLIAARDTELLARVFGRVIDNGKMLRNFIQMVRSGVAGRKSLGTRPKKLVGDWLNAASDAQLLAASVGKEPSLGDVIRLAHPKAKDETRAALFGWLAGRPVDAAKLPDLVKALEAFRQDSTQEMPKVAFELLTSLPLTKANWRQIARNASWQQTRMNLNTFLRQGVFEDKAMVDLVADRLRNAELVVKARVFPYQLLAAYMNVSCDMPSKIVNALQDAMELATANVPAFGVDTEILVDVSRSMQNAVTGNRPGATSKVRCIDVASLFASVALRRNEDANVTPFDTRVHQARLNPRDAIVTNAKFLAHFGGGGTDCACALAALNQRRSMAKLVIYVSDNESWVAGRRTSKATATMAEWAEYKRRVKGAKLVCIDITPNTTSQAKEAQDVLNVGGFSDEVFNLVGKFARGEMTQDHWVGEIEKVEL